MENKRDLSKLTIYEIYVHELGREKADQFFKKFNAEAEGKNAAELKKLIYRILCELSITDIQIYSISDFLIKMVWPR